MTIRLIALGQQQLGQESLVGELFLAGDGQGFVENCPDRGQAQPSTSLIHGRDRGLLGEAAAPAQGRRDGGGRGGKTHEMFSLDSVAVGCSGRLANSSSWALTDGSGRVSGDYRGGFHESALGKADNPLHIHVGKSTGMTVRTGPTPRGNHSPPEGFDGDDVGADSSHIQCGDSCLDVAEIHRAVEQKDVDRFTGSLGVSLDLARRGPKASWALVKVPDSRARAGAVEPGSSPGLVFMASR